MPREYIYYEGESKSAGFKVKIYPVVARNIHAFDPNGPLRKSKPVVGTEDGRFHISLTDQYGKSFRFKQEPKGITHAGYIVRYDGDGGIIHVDYAGDRFNVDQPLRTATLPLTEEEKVEECKKTSRDYVRTNGWSVMPGCYCYECEEARAIANEGHPGLGQIENDLKDLAQVVDGSYEEIRTAQARLEEARVELKDAGISALETRRQVDLILNQVKELKGKV